MTIRRSGFVSELGRSMVEMLGVLAIVGILSIGGISAFQKAMTKHKINKTTEEFSQFINELLRYSKDLKRMHTNNEANEQAYIAPSIEFFLPSTWRRESIYLYDSMNNRINPFIRNDQTGVKNKYLSLDYKMQKGKDNTQFCIALYNMAKPYAEMLRKVTVYTDDGEHGTTNPVWGTIDCGKNKKCLTDITFADIINYCNTCNGEKKGCTFVIMFRL
ncbi:MAG: type II secretion system protein [Alphaproteobacteria bacterium]|nr:type II secretion system protein [Alphaproteobacteria bacterium]